MKTAFRRRTMALTVMLFFVILFGPVHAQQKGWDGEWNEAMAGAKKDGKVVVATSPDPVMREIAAKFKARFGVTLEHLAGSSSQLAARLDT
jgi:ABC-type molybdate transport system substrate-binding protein